MFLTTQIQTTNRHTRHMFVRTQQQTDITGHTCLRQYNNKLTNFYTGHTYYTQNTNDKHLYRTCMFVTPQLQTRNIQTQQTCLRRHNYKQQTFLQDTHVCDNTTRNQQTLTQNTQVCDNTTTNQPTFIRNTHMFMTTQLQERTFIQDKHVCGDTKTNQETYKTHVFADTNTNI